MFRNDKINARSIRSLFLILAIGALFGVILTGRAGFVQKTSASQRMTSVIVELAGDPVVVAKARARAANRSFSEEVYRKQVIAAQNQFLQRLTAAGVPYTISGVRAPNGPVTPELQHRWNYVYNGIALELPEQTIPLVSALQDVLGIHPNEQVELHLDRAVNYTRASQLYGTPPKLARFDTLNSGGAHGEGVNIAVIDTGVDWTHEMFGGDPTPPQYGAAPALSLGGINSKVIYYMNFTPAVEPDDYGHGTHVAGIAAGYKGFAPGPDGLPMTADDVAVHGAAPQAKIMAYKVLAAVGSGVAASIISAIEDAVQPRTITGQPKPVAHVINLSLGGAGNADSPNSVACDNAALAGAIVVASAGNEGPGEGTVGQPASSRRAITVGANIDPGSGPNSIDVIGGGRTRMNAYSLAGAAPINADITQNYVFCGLAETPADVPDSVSGKIALIARGSTVDAGAAGTGLFSNKAAFAAAKGAVAAVIYNNVEGDLNAATVRKAVIPVVGISKEHGEYLKGLIGSTAVGAVSAQQIRINKAQLFDPAMATFSSRGPVAGFGQVKPDVTAPGVDVLSATVAVGSADVNAATMFDPTRYISVSGTSMSSPMTAGIAALIKQKNPSWTPSMVKAALVNTATNLRQINGAPLATGANTITDQGGGLVDALAAANAKALMGVGQPATTGQPQGRTFGILAATSAGSPDFTPSYSFGEVPIANVIGTASISQQVWIHDITGGQGAGTYNLAVAPVRNVDQTGFRVSFTDAAGNAITSISVPSGGSASFFVKTEVSGESVPASPTDAEWYITAARTSGGQNLRMPFYYRAVQPSVTLAAPALAALNGTEVSGNPPEDINGAYSLSYTASGAAAPAKFRIEEQKNGGQFATLEDVDGGQTSFDISNRSNGLYGYRVAGLFAVEHGLLKGPYSNVSSVQVDRRVESDVSNLVQTAIANVSLSGGTFEFDQTLKNISTDRTIFAPLKLSIVSIRSQSGTVRASNADNNGDGVTTPAVYDYSNTVGADRAFAPGETTGARHLKFADPASELFEFTAVIRGHFPETGAALAMSGSNGEGKKRKFKIKLRFIADPATGSVSLAGIE